MTTDGTTSRHRRGRHMLAAVTLAVALVATACIQESGGSDEYDDAVKLCVCTETLAVLNAAKWAGTTTAFTTYAQGVRGGGPKYQIWILGTAQLGSTDGVARAAEIKRLVAPAGHLAEPAGPPTSVSFTITSAQKNPEWSFSIQASKEHEGLIVQTWSRKEADAEFAVTLRKILKPILD